MHRFERLLRRYCMEKIKNIRIESLHMTQEKIAEGIHISVRGYQKLEHGQHTPCGATLALFLNQLSDGEMVAFVREFAQRVEEAHDKEVA